MPTLTPDMADVADSHVPDTQTVPVTAIYWLSEAGRKAALLAGLDGSARQVRRIDVPITRLHLITVDVRGRGRLKLRPRYERNGDQRIIRINDAPTLDGPPTLEDLFALAARNYELERAYHAALTQRLDAERDFRASVATAFLADPSQRALPHPAPTPSRCHVMTERGRRIFETGTDQGPAAQLPVEAHRRFRADLRTRAEKNRETRAAQLALHEEKKRAMADWIAAHGTPDQQARQAAGVLPLAEAIEALTDEVFVNAGARPHYERDGVARLQAHLRKSPAYGDAVVSPRDLVVTNIEASTASQAQWALLEELRAALPAATVTLRAHRLHWKADPRAPALTVYNAVVTQKVGLFTLRREYAAPE